MLSKKSLTSSQILLRSVSLRYYGNSATEASEAYRIANPVMRKAILEGIDSNGPPSLRTRRARLAYQTPQGLNEVFPLAYEIIKDEKKSHYQEIEKLTAELQAADTKDTETKAKLQEEILKHQVRAELHDPEVQYNFRMGLGDLSLPIYRYLAERQWKEYEQILNIDRLENLHVIPDTMPTIDLRARVRLQFPTYSNRWVTPGDVLRNEVASKVPILEVQEFEEIANGALYTILVVDPDTPDVENDTYSQTLHWAVSNVPLSNTMHRVDLARSDELLAYLPPHPEKNTPKHRYCVWVFRQSRDPKQIQKLDVAKEDLVRANFDIRGFADKYNLDAVGAHFWRVQFDRSTEAVREKFGLGPGRVFSKIRTSTKYEE